MTLDLTTRRPGEVSRAQRVFKLHAERDPFGHIKLRDELNAGNPYALRKLQMKGYTWDDKRKLIVSL